MRLSGRGRANSSDLNMLAKCCRPARCRLLTPPSPALTMTAQQQMGVTVVLSRRAFNAAVMTAGAAAAAGPVWASPDEWGQGKLTGYPKSSREWDSKPYRVGNYSDLASTRPTSGITAGPNPRPLVGPEGVASPLPPDLLRRLAEHKEKFAVTGLLLAQGERVLFEGYGYDRQPSMQFHGWSMTKSVLATLTGIAFDDGLLKSVDDTASRYVPELAGTLHGETRLKDLLQMSTGARVLHKPGAGGDLGEIYGNNLLTSRSDTLELIRGWNVRGEAAGQRFNYNELAPMTIAHVLRRATGKPLSEFAQERLWKPMGAESGASWMLDSRKMEVGCVGFSATLRDWTRLGLLLADDGRYGARQIVSREWLLKMTTVGDADTHLRPKVATSHSGYGYLTWVEAYRQRRVFSMRGHQNQYVIVAPQLRLVLAQTAVDDQPAEFAQNLYGLYTAVMAELERRPVPSAPA